MGKMTQIAILDVLPATLSLLRSNSRYNVTFCDYFTIICYIVVISIQELLNTHVDMRGIESRVFIGCLKIY